MKAAPCDRNFKNHCESRHGQYLFPSLFSGGFKPSWEPEIRSSTESPDSGQLSAALDRTPQSPVYGVHGRHTEILDQTGRPRLWEAGCV